MSQTQAEAQYQKMTQTPMPRLVTSLALPTVGSMLVSSIYNLTDTFFVSQLGTSASAAVGVVFSVQSLIQAVGFTLGMGCGAMVSRRLGQQDIDSACQYVSTAFLMELVLGGLIGGLGLLFLQPLMVLLGSTPTMLPFSCDYARYILMAAPIACASFVLNVSMQSAGRAVLSMLGLTVGNLLNIALDPVLIFGLKMGCAGAAIATAFSQVVSFVMLLFFFTKKQDTLRLRPQSISRDPSVYLTIVRLGAPTLCRQGCASLASALLNNRAMLYGDAAVAAMSIANRIYTLVRQILVGIGQGFQPVAGYNCGAGRADRVRSSFRFTVLLGTGVAVFFAGILALCAPEVMTVFRRDDPEVIRVGAHALRLLCLVLPLLAYSTYVNQMLQCLGRSGMATFLASCRQGTIYIPLLLLLTTALGFTGIPLCQPIADAATFLISIPFHLWFFRSEKGLTACLGR